MENKNMIIAAVIAIVVVVAAVGAYMVFSGNGNDNGQDEPTGDTYYVYLDGMGDINGWYTGTGADAEEAMVSALTAKGITVDTSGWGIQINDFIQDGSNGYAIYGYCSNTTENAWAGYFFTGPVIENVTSNIIYISYGPYTMDAEYNIKYDVVPTDALMSTGPFVDPNYKPLEYTGTYWIYLDGMGDINGWYTGTGADAEEAMVSALTAKGITVDTSGWGIQINDFIQDGSNGYAIYGYCSNTTENAWAGYFFTGPVIENVTSNIIYISYGPYTMDAEYNIKYDVVPTDALMSTGPFATA